MTLHIRQTILNHLIGKGIGYGPDHAIYVYTTDLVRLFPTVSDPLRRLRELKEDKIDYEYLGKRQYKIWLNGNGSADEGVAPVKCNVCGFEQENCICQGTPASSIPAGGIQMELSL